MLFVCHRFLNICVWEAGFPLGGGGLGRRLSLLNEDMLASGDS